jgi:hypothetical protein
MVQPPRATTWSRASRGPHTTRCLTSTRRRRREDGTTCAERSAGSGSPRGWGLGPLSWRRSGGLPGPQGGSSAGPESLRPSLSPSGTPPGATTRGTCCPTRWARARVRQPTSTPQHLALGGHHRPSPGGGTFQALHRLGVLELAGFARSPHRVSLVELPWLRGESTQNIRRQGTQWRGRFGQPVQPRVGRHREAPRRGAAPPALRQPGPTPPGERHGGLLAVAKRAMGRQQGTRARRAVDLAPGPAARRARGAQMAQPAPAAVGTTGRQTNMPGGIAWTGAPGRRGHGGGR